MENLFKSLLFCTFMWSMCDVAVGTATVPIYRGVNGGYNTFYSLNKADMATYGYTYTNILGWGLPATATDAGTTPVYQYRSSNRLFYTTVQAEGVALGSSYTLDGIAFVVYTNATIITNLYPCYRFYNGGPSGSGLQILTLYPSEGGNVNYWNKMDYLGWLQGCA